MVRAALNHHITFPQAHFTVVQYQHDLPLNDDHVVSVWVRYMTVRFPPSLSG